MAQTAWAQHKTANRNDLQYETTPPIDIRVGITAPGESLRSSTEHQDENLVEGLMPLGAEPRAEMLLAPRPDLNGLRVKLPNRAEVYMVDRGLRRWIPNPMTYNNLFRDWNGIVVDININDIALGPSITSGAVLARPSGFAPVYLIDHGVKRWISSPAIMDKYNFSWDRVYVVPPVLIDSIPTGQTIDS